jgi:hypothetical protein
VAAWGPGLVRRLLHLPTSRLEQFFVYMVGSLVFGIFMSKLIEFPVLRLRDRIFPAMQSMRAKIAPAEVSEQVVAAGHGSV